MLGGEGETSGHAAGEGVGVSTLRVGNVKGVGHWVLRGGVLYWTALMIYLGIGRAYEPGLRPWLWTSAWALALIYIGLHARYAIGRMGSFVAGLASLLAGMALYSPAAPMALPGWFIRTHVAFAFIGVIAFTFASASVALFDSCDRVRQSCCQKELSCAHLTFS